MQNENKLGPEIEILLATIIWGFGGVIIKVLALPPTTIASFRMMIPAIILFLFFKFLKKTKIQWTKKLLLVSGLNAVRMLLYFVALSITTLGNSLITLFTWPIFAAIFGNIFLKEKLTRRGILLIAIAFTGIILIYASKGISFADKDIIGMNVMLVSAAMYAVTVILLKKESSQVSGLNLVYHQNALGAIIFIPFIFLNPLPTLNQSIIAIIYAILIGLVGYKLFFSALKNLKTSIAATLATFELVAGVVLGVVLLGEALTFPMLLGGTMILISSILIKTWKDKLN